METKSDKLDLVRDDLTTTKTPDSDIPVSKLVPINRYGVEGLNNEQRQVLSGIYMVIAEALPLEGRDFRLDIKFGEHGDRSASIKLIGLTELGKYFAEHVTSKFLTSERHVQEEGPQKKEVL